MHKVYYSNAVGVREWLSEHIGPSSSTFSGHGWVMVNNFNRFARRMPTFWVEFEDWVTEEQRLAFALTWAST